MNFEEHLAKLNQQYSLPGAQSFAQPQNSIKPPKPSIDRNVQSTRNIDFFQPLAYAEQFDQEDIDVNLNEMHSEIMFAAFVETIDISRKSHTDQSHVAFADDWSRQKKEILASFGQQGNQWVPPDMKMNNIEQNKVVIQLDQPIKKDEDMKERLQNEILAKFYEVAHEYCMIRKDHYEGLEQYRNWGRIRNQKILEINVPFNLLKHSIRIIKSTQLQEQEFNNDNEMAQNDILDTFNLLRTMIKQAQQHIKNKESISTKETNIPQNQEQQQLPEMLSRIDQQTKDVVNTPINVSVLSLPSLYKYSHNEQQQSQSSSSSQSQIYQHSDSEEDQILRNSLTLQQGLIDGAIIFFEEQYETLILNTFKHHRADKQQPSFNINNISPHLHKNFITETVKYCRMKLSTISDNQLQQDEWPSELKERTLDGIPVWPVVYYCIRCGKLNDASYVMKCKFIAEAERQIQEQSKIMGKDQKQKNQSLFIQQSSSQSSQSSSSSDSNITPQQLLNIINLRQQNIQVNTTDPFKQAIIIILTKDMNSFNNIQSYILQTRQDYLWALMRCSDSEEIIYNYIRSEQTQTSSFPSEQETPSLSLMKSNTFDQMKQQQQQQQQQQVQPQAPFTIQHIAQEISQLGRIYFDSELNNPWPYIQYLISTQQFELAISELVGNSEPNELISNRQTSANKFKLKFIQTEQQKQQQQQQQQLKSILHPQRSNKFKDQCFGVHLMLILSQYGLLNEDYSEIRKEVSFDDLQGEEKENMEQFETNNDTSVIIYKSTQDVVQLLNDSQSNKNEKQNDSKEMMQDFEELNDNQTRIDKDEDSNTNQSQIIFIRPTQIISNFISTSFIKQPQTLLYKQKESSSITHSTKSIVYLSLTSLLNRINSQDHALQLISNIIDQSRDYNFFFGFTDPGIVQSNVLLSKQISDQQPPDNNNHKKKTIIPAQLQVNKSVGFLSTILPPQSVEQLALICAERCANEGRISSAVGLLLDTPGAEERGFIICDSFLSTFLLKQVHDHPQRRFILSKIQTYLNSRGFENIDQVQQTKNIILLSMSICILIGEASEQVDQLIGQDYQEQISQMNADQIRSGWERVIDLIDKSSIIPKTSEEIKLKLPLFINIQDQQQQQFEPQTNLLNCITNNIPEILILYSTALFELYKITKQESGQIFGSFGEQNTDYSQYQKRVHTAVTFAGHLPQDTIGDAHARMQQILVSME